MVIDKMNELRKELEERIEDDKPIHYYDERGILLGDEKFEMQISLLSVSEEEKQSARKKMKELRSNEVAMEIKHRKMIETLHAERNVLYKRACEELRKKKEEEEEQERKEQERMEQERKEQERMEQERKEQEKKAREEKEQVRMKQEREKQEMIRKELERKRMEQERERIEQERKRMERFRMLVGDGDDDDDVDDGIDGDDDDDDDIDVVSELNSEKHTITATIKYINGKNWVVASFDTYDLACLTDIITGTYHVRHTDIKFRFHRRIADEVKLFMNRECLHWYDEACRNSDNEYEHD
jgi:ATPase subunit of ABC transporter with duplicated ATPase domains